MDIRHHRHMQGTKRERQESSGKIPKKEKRRPGKRAPGYERLITVVLWGGISLVIAGLFYDSLPAAFALLPGVIPFAKERRRTQKQNTLREMEGEFLMAMQLTGTALTAGYAVENAFREAWQELKRMFPEDAWVVDAFSRLVAGLSLNRPVEELLTELADTSQAPDIEAFAQVFVCARRTGGDLMHIVRNTISAIRQCQETQREIDTVLAGKRMEQRMMSVIPLFILGYIRLTSPDFLQPLYHNFTGAIVMTGCLGVYAAAYLWGKHIMEIEA